MHTDATPVSSPERPKRKAGDAELPEPTGDAPGERTLAALIEMADDEEMATILDELSPEDLEAL